MESSCALSFCKPAERAVFDPPRVQVATKYRSFLYPNIFGMGNPCARDMPPTGILLSKRTHLPSIPPALNVCRGNGRWDGRVLSVPESGHVRLYAALQGFAGSDSASKENERGKQRGSHRVSDSVPVARGRCAVARGQRDGTTRHRVLFSGDHRIRVGLAGFGQPGHAVGRDRVLFRCDRYRMHAHRLGHRRGHLVLRREVQERIGMRACRGAGCGLFGVRRVRRPWHRSAIWVVPG